MKKKLSKELSAGTEADSSTKAEGMQVSPADAKPNVASSFNVVFLDIDGVLNTPQNAIERFDKWKDGIDKTRDEFGQLFCPKAVSNLEYLCHTANAKVVVSSTWRRSGLAKIQAMFQMRDIKVDVIDITPDLSRMGENGLWMAAIRGEEIAEWLRNNDVDNYVILDDDKDMTDEQQPFFVRTNFEDGFNWQCMVSALKILMPK